MLMVLAISCWLLFSLASADEVLDALKATPTATIANGKIVGTTTNIAKPSCTGSIGVNKFLGIPYAAPPIHENRFAPPRAPGLWDSLDTKRYGASCVQAFGNLIAKRVATFANQGQASGEALTRATFDHPVNGSSKESEDCLYINVFAPKKQWNPDSPPYPVLYWMYGGTLQWGNTAQTWYDGSHFAALEDVIVVSVNYRTNAFGLPISPAIGNLTERNLAVLDQRAGLQWIQTNIRHFGGDSSRVTIFGESAGAYSVDLLVSSYPPNATRPFHAAIMQSVTYAYLPLKACNNDNYDLWNGMSAALNCTGTDAQKFACVKYNRTATDIKFAQDKYTINVFASICDNVTTVSNPRARLEAGNVANIPVMLGSNTAEGSVYTIPFGLNTTAFFLGYFSNLEQDYPTLGIDLQTFQKWTLGNYSLNATEGRPDAQYQMQQIYTDFLFHCPVVWYAETSTAHNPTYRYLFNATFANMRVRYPDWPEEYQGAYHMSEVPLVFTSYEASAARNESKAQRQLSDRMRTAWASFAKDPSHPPLQGWPLVGHGTQGRDVMGFGTDGKGGSGVIRDESAERCAYLERVGFKMVHA